MKKRSAFSYITELCLLLVYSSPAYCDLVTFGSGANQFTMTFVEIGSPGNQPDLTGNPNPAGSVGYQYKIGKYEVSRDMVIKANGEGSLGITLDDLTAYGGNGLNRPATGISFWEAAHFANWLNTSQGFHVAYRFDKDGNPIGWDSADAWQLGGENLFRHKDAHYWVTSNNEWYKAAYFQPVTSGYFDYPTSDGSIPIPVSGGTDDKTAVIYIAPDSGPADITNAGGLSASGVMGLGGNVWEVLEQDSLSGVYKRGGAWFDALFMTKSAERFVTPPAFSRNDQGFRIAGLSSVPEPNSLAISLSIGMALLCFKRNARLGIDISRN